MSRFQPKAHDPALDRKFNQDLIWNYTGMVVMVLSGILVNLVVGGYYGVQGLGVFTQVYALYAVASQFASGGLQYSALKHVAENAGDGRECSLVAWSAALLALVVGGLVSMAVFLAGPVIGGVMDSEAVGLGISRAAPGLFFFGLNKVFLGVLNGMRHMRAFAVGQSLRYALTIILVTIISLLGLPAYALGTAFTLAEASLFVLLAIMVLTWAAPNARPVSAVWLKRHAVFGLKGFMSPLIVEMNIRMDVTVLGLFLADRQVGIYSFAAMVAEGFANLLVVLRNNVNPILVPLVMGHRNAEIQAMFRRLAPKAYLGSMGLALVSLALYRPAVQLVLGGGEFLECWPVMTILLAGVVMNSGYVPFNFILIQAGQPGWHTMLATMNLLTNLGLNLALIPLLGIYGSALGTAVALVLSVLYLNFMVKQRLGFNFGLPLG